MESGAINHVDEQTFVSESVSSSKSEILLAELLSKYKVAKPLKRYVAGVQELLERTESLSKLPGSIRSVPRNAAMKLPFPTTEQMLG